MISILCLSCNAIFSAVSFRGQHAEVGDFFCFFGRDWGCCDFFFDIIYEGNADRNERVTEKGKRAEPPLHKNGKLVQLLTKMPTFSCSPKQELF